MSGSTKVPPIVSKRNEFRSVGELVEDAVWQLPDEFKHPKFRAWLTNYTGFVARSIASNFAVAAARGIEQAATLLCDPEFYEKKRERRARATKAMKQKEAEDRFEMEQRRNCPTAEQLKQQIEAEERAVKYYSELLLEHQAKLEKLKTMTPNTIRVAPAVIQ